MLRIKIISVGKTKEAWLEAALEEYTKRLAPHLQLETLWVRNDEQLIALAQEAPYLALDPQGKELDSIAFSRFLFQQLEKQGSRLTFLIGGPEGLPAELKKGVQLISLSKLTFTHQITRLILAEQLYRAVEIDRGSPYHK
jgi:23S rRNA (pseudouridine1915-N3)-methyltransferase